MSTSERGSGPILTIVITGAPLARRAADLTAAAEAAGWQVAYAVTESALPWVEGTIDLSDTGFRSPDQPKRPRPDALAVLPMTFNTGSKWAMGIADTRSLSLLCESLGAGKPIVAVPMINTSLWGHPAWPRHLDLLTDAGVIMIDPHTGQPGARALDTDDVEALVDAFEPRWILDALPTS